MGTPSCRQDTYAIVYLPISVADPHNFFSDPDPAFHFYVDPDSDSDPGFLLTKLQFFL